MALSFAESLGGNPQRGLELANYSIRGSRNGLFEVRGPLAAAEAYLILGDFHAALISAEGVQREAKARGVSPYVGVAARIAADAHLARGELAQARKQVDLALAFLAGSSHPYSLCRAHEMAIRFKMEGGDPHLAADLRAALTEVTAIPALGTCTKRVRSP